MNKLYGLRFSQWAMIFCYCCLLLVHLFYCAEVLMTRQIQGGARNL